MNKLKTILIIIGAIAVLAIAKGFKLGLVLEAPLLLITFLLIVKHRKSLGTWFKHLPLPTFVIALISTWPFMLFEENINCLPSGCMLIPTTIPFLTILVLIFLIILKIAKVKRFKVPVIIFSIFGFLTESTYGVSATQIWTLSFTWLVFFVPWISISYAYLVIVPTTILVDNQN